MVTQLVLEMPLLGRTKLFPFLVSGREGGWAILCAVGEHSFELLFYKNDAVCNPPALQLGVGRWGSQCTDLLPLPWGG